MFDQLPYTTSRIEAFTQSGKQLVGTGFFFNFEFGNGHSLPALITNKHVVNGANRARVHFSRSHGDAPMLGAINRWDIAEFDNCIVQHPDPAVDLAAFGIGGGLTEMQNTGAPAYYRAFSLANIPTTEEINSLTAIENILMIGYPTGIWDEKNNLPIVRRGITATPYEIDYNGKPEFVIDCACFPGSSGSPVMIADNGTYSAKSGGMIVGSRFHLLGLLWGGPQYSAEGEIVVRPVPTGTGPVSVSQIPINLGYCIKSRMIRDLEPLLKAQIKS